jgi:hypothetical protein
MIEIFGPNYKYTGEILTTPEIIYINDHHYDETDRCFHVQKLLENSACDTDQHTLIFDHVNHEDALKEYKSVCVPLFLASEAEEFKKQNIEINWGQKTHLFNFMINKPRLHREFLLMLIEHFNLYNYTHSLAWKSISTSNTTLSGITTNPLYLDIINSCYINTPVTNYKFGPEITMEKGIKNGNFTNAETYKHLLKENVFEPACISLITEPCFYEKEALVSEKTLMSIFGGNLPIWVGGWRCADSMKYLGFDVFDDIIDHSYQHMEDPLDRCYYAIERNLDLLKNFEQTKQFVNKNQDRLQYNLDLVLSNVFLKECFDQVEKNPEIKDVLMRIIPAFRHNMFAYYRNFKDYKLHGKIVYGAIHDKTGLV